MKIKLVWRLGFAGFFLVSLLTLSFDRSDLTDSGDESVTIWQSTRLSNAKGFGICGIRPGQAMSDLRQSNANFKLLHQQFATVLSWNVSDSSVEVLNSSKDPHIVSDVLTYSRPTPVDFDGQRLFGFGQTKQQVLQKLESIPHCILTCYPSKIEANDGHSILSIDFDFYQENMARIWLRRSQEDTETLPNRKGQSGTSALSCMLTGSSLCGKQDFKEGIY
jgi:hypothetical protein